MSILLQARGQSREGESREGGGIVQQPGSFYNGNPSSSIWGRNSSGSFWKNPVLLNGVAAAASFDFGFQSQVENSSSVLPPPVESLDSKSAQNRPELFVFGSIANTASSSSGSSSSSSAVGGDQNACSPAVPVFSFHALPKTQPGQPVEEMGSMLHDMHIGSGSSPVASSFPSMASIGGDRPLSAGHDRDFSKPFTVGTTPAPAGHDTDFSKPFTVGTTPAPALNPRPRFTKLRKSVHSARGNGQRRDQNPIFESRASSPDSATFQTGEPSSLPEEPQVVNSGIEKEVENKTQTEEQSNQEFGAQAEADTKSESFAFAFTAMREAVPVIPEPTQSLADELRAMKVEEKGSNEPVSSSAATFVFTAGSGQSRPTEEERPPLQSDNTFVFKSTGQIPVTRKKRTPKRASTLFKEFLSTSADDQGSPMDVSPCPDTGARLSPQVTASNSETEEGDQPWNAQFQFYSEPSEKLEDLREAAAELNLGSQSEDSKENDVPRKKEAFSFTASSPSAPSKRRPRRNVKPGSKGKGHATRSSVKQEVQGMDIDNSKTDAGGWKQSTLTMDFSGPSTSTTTTSHPNVEQACEKWRQRGNQAYTGGDFQKAEEYYSLGISSVPPNETSQNCVRASMLCYSNRAATRMAIGRMREALGDCSRAIAIDPNFLRVRLRAGSCHLSLGEVDSALSYFKYCLEHANITDLKIASEASEGLDKTQHAQDFFQQVKELVSANDHTSALGVLDEALVISPHSEIFLELRARCLLSLRKYSEVLQLCDQTLVSSESNWTRSPQSEVILGFRAAFSPAVWRSWASSKSLFALGRLKDALDCLQKLGNVLAVSGDERISYIQEADLDTLSQFIALLQQLLEHKAAGNEAFQAGRHTDAVDHYTAALACNGETRPFNAVLFCNRAAASQALGHIADAIADSSRAVALDPTYLKAISRRVTLHTLIRDYGQACNDLRRLISLLETDGPHQELKQARERLINAEEDLKKCHPVDHYLVLGLEPSCSPAEIKKSYRKLALRHHPDKAAQLVVRTDGGDTAKDVGEEIRGDAERLFKLIGEAYAILSDPPKRLRYDKELRTRGMNSNPSSENHRYQPFDRSNRRQRDRWDAWSGYAHQYQRWHSDGAQSDSYSRQSRYATGRSSDFFNWDDL